MNCILFSYQLTRSDVRQSYFFGIFCIIWLHMRIILSIILITRIKFIFLGNNKFSFLNNINLFGYFTFFENNRIFNTYLFNKRPCKFFKKIIWKISWKNRYIFCQKINPFFQSGIFNVLNSLFIKFFIQD